MKLWQFIYLEHSYENAEEKRWKTNDWAQRQNGAPFKMKADCRRDRGTAQKYFKDPEKHLQVKSIRIIFSYLIYSALAKLLLPFKSFWNPTISFKYEL